MKYYKTWQEALIEFVRIHGEDFKDSYNLTAEFEQKVKQNIHGAWYYHE